jgi:hypothetical protein
MQEDVFDEKQFLVYVSFQPEFSIEFFDFLAVLPGFQDFHLLGDLETHSFT